MGAAPRRSGDDDARFARAIARARKKAKLSVYALAKLSDVNTAQIYRLESDEGGGKGITLATAIKLARALRISVDEIVKLGDFAPDDDTE